MKRLSGAGTVCPVLLVLSYPVNLQESKKLKSLSLANLKTNNLYVMHTDPSNDVTPLSSHAVSNPSYQVSMVVILELVVYLPDKLSLPNSRNAV